MAGAEPTSLATRKFLQALRTFGYDEGTNLILERRSAEGRADRFEVIVAELIARKVDVIVTVSNEATKAAKNVTSSMPIVMASSLDPVGAGLIDSLARPGGNVTGVTAHTGPEFDAKRLQLLSEVVPKMKRIGCLSTNAQWTDQTGQHVRDAALALGITLIHAPHTSTDYAAAFALLTRQAPLALLVPQDVSVTPNRQLIADFVIANRIPGIFPIREIAEAGGLMSYGADYSDQMRRAASLVDKVLKGARPADLPVELPTKFQLVVNQVAAKSLGITIPESILIRADEVIE
jgi:putative tryptophan/tyrosine transport system substrate-binding protein